MGARDGEFMRVRSKWDHGVNLETLCARGRFGLDFVASEDRIKRPMIRRDGALVPASWDEAGAWLRERMSEVLAAGKAVGGLASPRMTNEALYQFQKLMRAVFGTNNINSSSRWSAPFDALAPLIGNFYQRAPLDEVIRADCVLVVGSNVNEENPVTEYLLRGAARNSDTALYVLSTRPSRLDADARGAIRVPPGGEAAILGAIVARLLEAPADRVRLRAAFSNLGAVQAALRPSASTDSEAFARLVAALSGGASVTLLAGTDMLRSPDASAALRMLHGLAQVLRALGKATAAQFLFDRANQFGAWDLGVLPAALPGLRPVGDPAARTTLEQAWGTGIPSEPGAGLDRMLELCAAGTMGLLYLAGTDPLLSYPDRALVSRALAGVDLVIVQDAYLTDTVGVADAVLPAASFGEESGTVVSNEGRIQRANKFREPPFEARPNLEIFGLVAALRGRTLDPAATGEVFDEIARLVPSYRGLTQGGLGDDGAFTASRPQPSDGKLVAPPSPAAVRTDGLALVTGNCLFHSGYVTERSEILRSIADEPFAEMNPQDAEALGLSAQDLVEVRSPRGMLQARLKLGRSFPSGLVFVPENFRILRLNGLLKAGEYPCPVQVTKAAVAAAPPLEHPVASA